MPPEKHALLGASSAHRWIHCPPSARLTQGMPDHTSTYAEAGRLAHEIAELKARQYFIETLPNRTYQARLKKLQAHAHYEKSMDSATDVYLEHLKVRAMAYPEPPSVALEVRVCYDHIAPEGFGTADCIMIGSGRMDVVDYKNGAGVLVEAEHNPQLMLYALGALREYAVIFGDSIRTIHLSIVQPNAGGVNAGGVREWETTAEALRQWAETTAAPAARLAWEGTGDFQAGDWCRFCKAKAQCAARARQMLALEQEAGGIPAGSAGVHAYEGTDTPLLSDAQVGDALTRGREVAGWVKDLEAYAMKATLEGRVIAGWKVVEGRVTRDWTGGIELAFPELRARGVEEALLYERRPVTVAGLEKALGKKVFGETAEGLWAKSPGKPTLVPEDDPRQPYNAAAAAFTVAGEA